ncbi:MAG: peptide-N-glycosidase F-related protein [Myxococcota bacterium]
MSGYRLLSITCALSLMACSADTVPAGSAATSADATGSTADGDGVTASGDAGAPTPDDTANATGQDSTVPLACDNLCEAGAERCSEDMSTIESCMTGSDGCFQWFPQATCLAGDLCIDAACITPVTPYDFESAAPWYSCPSEFPTEGVTVVTAFDAADQYFGEPNLRKIEAQAEFPAPGSWSKVGLWFHLECPENGLCDHWDRSGSIQLVLNPDAAEGEPREHLELLRHITPYRVEMCQFVDITPLAHLLTGTQTLTSWIDTWVGPGHAQGEGWRVTAKFVFYQGADAGADEVLNVWGRRNITVGEIEQDANVDSQFEPVSIAIPEAATQVRAHLTTTGHSFGNTYNCAEFCEMRHDILVNGVIAHSINPWRNDCAQNPVSPQYGTWEYPRNGWCPGGSAVGHIVDLTDHVTPGESVNIDLDIRLYDGQEYDNTSPVDLLPYTYVALKLYAYE